MTIETTDKPLIKKRVLIVDDHPFIIQGYKNAITRYKPNEYEFIIDEAVDCKSGYEMITNPESNVYDFAFLDISMPKYDEKGILSGEDLAILLHQYMPSCKVILLTMYTELLKIKNIINAINPSGLVIKNDLDFNELIFGFDKVINDEIYYSNSIQVMIDQELHEPIEIGVFDKQILFHISKGTKIEEMSEYIPLSQESIQIRRLNLMELLGVEDGSDETIVIEAKKRGLLF